MTQIIIQQRCPVNGVPQRGRYVGLSVHGMGRGLGEVWSGGREIREGFPEEVRHESKLRVRASLVAQWLGVCLPMQGTRVRALVWEDPTCRGATRPRVPQLLSLHVWSLCSATREAAIVRGPRTAMKSGARSPQLEKALARKWRPNTAKSR